MDKALDREADAAASATESVTGRKPRARDWRKRMSDHIAYALLVYTALQILVTSKILATDENSIMPYFALVMLVIAIIPACRLWEKRWDTLDNAGAADPAHAGRFRRDIAVLWACAIGAPLALGGVFKLAGLVF